mmetsp:Transcript_15312/g.30083  ORF Transcript_15312/g.30083 Transcript_15312/m.30083 type:complete len:382 (-) Transcript_15312:25-1170(-)
MSEAKEEVVTDITNPDVVEKYRIAGEIANNCILHVAALCCTGARIVSLCDAGDQFIQDACGKIFKGKGVEKGVAFPVCISVNNTMGHFSPLADDQTCLAEGDFAKIDLGVHIDGYVAVTAHTILVGEKGPSTEEIAGRKADAMNAAYWAAECAIRMMKNGQKSEEITKMSQEVAEAFNCKPVSGVLSHQLDRFNLDGKKQVLMVFAQTDQAVENFVFEPKDVFAFDMVMSSGEGKPRDERTRTTVYNRRPETTYQLKIKSSRQVLSEINQKFPNLPFTLRNLNQKTVKFGINECRDHGLVEPYPVLYEKAGEIIAHIKFTALLTANGTVKISGVPINIDQYKSEFKLTDEKYLALLQTSSKKKRRNNKKKKAAATSEEKKK